MDFPYVARIFDRFWITVANSAFWTLTLLTVLRTGAKGCQQDKTRLLPSFVLHLYPLVRRTRLVYYCFLTFSSGLVREFFISSPTSFRRLRKIFKPRLRTSLRANFFAHRVISPWNALPKVANSHSEAKFKIHDIHLGFTLQAPPRVTISPIT